MKTPLDKILAKNAVMTFGRECERRYLGAAYHGSQNDTPSDAVRHASAAAYAAYFFGSTLTEGMGWLNELAESTGAKSEGGKASANRTTMDTTNNRMGAALGDSIRKRHLKGADATEAMYQDVTLALRAGLLVPDLSPASMKRAALLDAAGAARHIEQMGLAAYIARIDSNHNGICEPNEIKPLPFTLPWQSASEGPRRQ